MWWNMQDKDGSCLLRLTLPLPCCPLLHLLLRKCEECSLFLWDLDRNSYVKCFGVCVCACQIQTVELLKHTDRQEAQSMWKDTRKEQRRRIAGRCRSLPVECLICCTCLVIGFNLCISHMCLIQMIFLVLLKPALCPSNIILRHQPTTDPLFDLSASDSAGYNEYCKRVHYLQMGVINHHSLYALVL